MRRLLRSLALIAMMVGVTGCFAWGTVGALPKTADLPMEIRVTQYDGAALVLTQSRIENDTIRGFTAGSNVRHVIPLAAVDLIEAKQFKVKQSLIAGSLVGGLVWLVVKGLQSTKPFGPIPTSP